MITPSIYSRTATSLVIALLGSLTGCSTVSHFAGAQAAKASGRTTPVEALTSGEINPSGILPLTSGTEAFVARVALASKARKTLDLQYYIWHSDQTGKLLAGAMIEAAERGVKTRLLLDDMGTAADDRNLLVIDSHPNIEVRLFNPIHLRSARMLSTLLDFKRVNRRMHNKSFIVDGRVAIIGGRNIGDEYFGAADDMNFADFDVAANGPVVSEVADAFELYWNCEASKPITQVSQLKITAADLQLAKQELLSHRETLKHTRYAQAMRTSKLASTPLNEIPFLKGRAVVVVDSPEKVSTRPDDTSTHLTPQLRGIVDATKKELCMVSPYFIPGKKGVDWFAALKQRGVKVRVITNSLGSTDVAAVHAGYAKYREPLLKNGTEIYELKTAPPNPENKTERSRSSLSLTGSSKAGLHAKTFVFDRRWVFVGSMNFDPRSVKLNTEIGMIIDSPELAEQMLQRIDTKLPEATWCVECTSNGLQWTTHEQGKPITQTSEPTSTFSKRFIAWVVSWLPIESQL